MQARQILDGAAQGRLPTGVQLEELSIVGGNVEDAVTLEHLHTNDEGELRGNRENWFVVLRVMYRRN